MPNLKQNLFHKYKLLFLSQLLEKETYVIKTHKYSGATL